MHKVVKKVLVTEKELKKIIKRVAGEIEFDYKYTDFTMIGLLKGCIPFLSSLALQIKLDYKIEYLSVSSYEGTDSRKNDSLNIKTQIDFPIKDQHILLVDDIIDSGITLQILKDKLLEMGAKSVKIAVLLDKKEGRKNSLEADYVGTRIPNEFVIGFGLDYDELYRNLPYIGVFDQKYLK